ncbi:hypothetical protein AYI69_g491 [Smittium culicis]|uniref:Uncharacterized protein n=1 Tax=Smittium culicis TaxID=133412 RepID=A0A1R1YSY4_9FUNG|nr:hypothetical protein AYI69_g491 [Smittium culicis]
MTQQRQREWNHATESKTPYFTTKTVKPGTNVKMISLLSEIVAIAIQTRIEYLDTGTKSHWEVYAICSIKTESANWSEDFGNFISKKPKDKFQRL